MRKPLVLATLVAALALILAAGALAATKTVKVGDNYFVRASGVPTVSVTKGTKVTWAFRGGSDHNVTAGKGPVKFASPTKSSGSYSRKMTRRGTYKIYCSVHGAADQSMKLVVK